jgi:hypothetical protein
MAIDDPRREGALELVRAIRYQLKSDEEVEGPLNELQRLIPHPAWMDLLYWHTPELSDDEVVDKALEYRPIAL